MTFEQFLTGIRTRWLLILSMVLITVATTVGQSLMHGKIYVSHALVLVDMYAIDPMTKRNTPGLATEPQQQLFFLNKIFLALNEEVARRMAAMDPTLNSPEFIEYWEHETDGKGDIVSWYAKILSDSILINIPKNTTIIDFGAYGQSPERAAALANAYAKSYIDVSNAIKLRNTQARVEALQVHSQKIKKELDATWKEFLAARSAGGIESLDELGSKQNQQTLQLNLQLSEKRAEQINAKNRLQEFGKNAANVPELASLNLAIHSLSTDIVHEKAQLQQYKALYGPQHPAVKEGEARLAELQQRLDTEALRVQQQEKLAVNMHEDSARQLYQQLDIEKVRTAKENEARSKLIGLAQRIASLTLNYSEAYQAERADTTSGLISFSNLTMLSPATPPTKSSLPNWPFIVTMAALVGLAIGVGAATLIERLDGRIHSPRLIQEKTQLPTLGVLHTHTSS